jgi:hypothetical protein
VVALERRLSSVSPIQWRWWDRWPAYLAVGTRAVVAVSTTSTVAATAAVLGRHVDSELILVV